MVYILPYNLKALTEQVKWFNFVKKYLFEDFCFEFKKPEGKDEPRGVGRMGIRPGKRRVCKTQLSERREVTVGEKGGVRG